MSIYNLQSEVNQLESKLRQITGENNALRNEISMVVNNLVNAENDLSRYNQHIRETLDYCNDSLTASGGTVVDAYELQCEIEKLYVRYKNIELANKKIRMMKNQLYYDFANHRTVRKIVQGLMDNLDLHMVSDRIIAKSIEKQHLQTPDFWLTCVLISIMAWKNDDKALAERAIERAVSLDIKNSSVFYMVFNYRMGREKAALDWFMNYRKCSIKGEDDYTFLMLFSLISKTMEQNIDEASSQTIKEYINQIISNSAAAEGYSEEGITERIKSYLDAMKEQDRFDYPLLEKCCGEYGMLADILQSAKNNCRILEFIMKLCDPSTEEKNNYLKEYIDKLVNKPFDKERGIYQNIDYNEHIIRNSGDVEAAKAQYAEKTSKAEAALDLISDLINWVYCGEGKNINGQVRLNMFSVTKGLNEKAINQYFEQYRNKRKKFLPVSVYDYVTQADLTDEQGERQKAETYYASGEKTELSKVKDLLAYIVGGVGAACAVGCIWGQFWVLAFTVAGLGYGAYKYLSNMQKRKQIKNKYKDAARNTMELLHKLAMEYQGYLSEYNEYDNVAEKITFELSKV